MNTKEKIINVINDGNIDDSTAKELIEGYLVDDILSEIKNNNCKLLVVSEGKKNRLNAEEVSYSLCNNDASRYNFNLATCLNDKEITDMIESAYGCNHTVLTMEVRKKLVEQFTNADTYDEKLKITDSILYFICGVKDIDDSKMWGYAKEKELKVIERMTGEEYIDHEGSRYPNNAAGPILSELYKDIRNMYCISMVGSEASDLLKLLLVVEKDGNSIIFGSDGDDKTLAGWGANIIYGGKGSDALSGNKSAYLCYAVA